jgi:hypothetical protein
MESTTVIQQRLLQDGATVVKPAWRRINSAQLGYAFAAGTIGIGWLLTRERILFHPLYGAGYWLGIVGASLMAVLLLYPVRKRVRFLRRFGATRHWFQMHMIFGVAGPILILYHCNFRFGSVNSTIALICTLLVAGSGLVGRYIYRHLYSDLDGHRLKLQELIANAKVDSNERMHMSALVPDLLKKMSEYDSKVLIPPPSFLSSLLLPVRLAFSTRIAALRLALYARRQIATRATESDVVAQQRQRLYKAATQFIQTHLRRVRRVAELQSFERLFALWHVFHLPFFYLMVLTALVHVLAVHMY